MSYSVSGALNLAGLVETNSAPEEDWVVEGLRSASEEAYETLVSRYQQPVYNLVRRLVDDPADACDVVQEVFLKIFRRIGQFRGESSLRTWIYRIAVNESHNHRRWFFRHRRREVALDDEQEGFKNPSGVADASQSPFDYVFDRERHVLIEEALSRINPNFRAAVVLRDVLGLSYEEIAEILQVSQGTVKSRIMRGREAMREQLAQHLRPERAFRLAPQPAE